MMNPGGTGRSRLLIAANPEPLPPRRSFISFVPSENLYTNFLSSTIGPIPSPPNSRVCHALSNYYPVLWMRAPPVRLALHKKSAQCLSCEIVSTSTQMLFPKYNTPRRLRTPACLERFVRVSNNLHPEQPTGAMALLWGKLL